MATVPDPQDPVARPRLILPGSIQSVARPKIVVPGVGLIDPDAKPDPLPAEPDAHLITEPLMETRQVEEPEIYLDDFLGDAREDDYPPVATEPPQLATPVLLSPPQVQPRPLGPPEDWTPMVLESMENFVDQPSDTDSGGAGQFPGQEESDEPVDFPGIFDEVAYPPVEEQDDYPATAQPEYPPAEEPVAPRIHPVLVPAIGGPRIAGQPSHAVPLAAGQVPRGSKYPATATAIHPGSSSLVPGWIMLVIGILIGLIGGVFTVAKTKASAKLGLMPTSRMNAHVLDVLMEERSQTQAMLNAYYRSKRIDLTKEMADFRTEQGRKAPEKMTMEDFRDPEDEAPANPKETKDDKTADPKTDEPETVP